MSQNLTARLSAMLGYDAGIGYAEATAPEGLWPEEAPAVARAILPGKEELLVVDWTFVPYERRLVVVVVDGGECLRLV